MSRPLTAITKFHEIRVDLNSIYLGSSTLDFLPTTHEGSPDEDKFPFLSQLYAPDEKSRTAVVAPKVLIQGIQHWSHPRFRLKSMISSSFKRWMRLEPCRPTCMPLLHVVPFLSINSTTHASRTELQRLPEIDITKHLSVSMHCGEAAARNQSGGAMLSTALPCSTPLGRAEARYGSPAEVSSTLTNLYSLPRTPSNKVQISAKRPLPGKSQSLNLLLKYYSASGYSCPPLHIVFFPQPCQST